MRFFGGEGVGSLGGRKARARLSERARESAGEESRGGPIVVRPSAHPRVRKQFVIEEARAMAEGCWRRSMEGEAAVWKVMDCMSGGVATRSWFEGRPSEECGPMMKDITWDDRFG